ncbi:hypothetical protein [Streptomyces nojiriensis]|uniref:hypothetical protein n=1 Tax=Streptomyces nojiriensis TaxID=66374 RepID=UPI0035D8DC6C
MAGGIPAQLLPPLGLVPVPAGVLAQEAAATPARLVAGGHAALPVLGDDRP